VQAVEETVKEGLIRRILTRDARVGVVGLGYVGLPLAIALAQQGFWTIGVDVDESKAASINEGVSYIGDIADAEIAAELQAGRFRATTDAAALSQCDCIVICVPTPLSRTNDPDLSFIESATALLKRRLRAGQLIILESTTYPGCTDELVRAELEQSGLRLDEDFLLAFSPERIDPGNAVYKTESIPRIVGGCTPASTQAAATLYRQVTPHVHPVSSARVAETAKLLENTFRAVNIGLVNELALMCYQMNIDIWEVIEAAKTKPYGFMPFYPGPGIGGHCIPLDPAYLSWRGRQFGFQSRFIDVAEGVNAAMPAYVVERVADALNGAGKPLNGSRILVIGASYKKDVADVRESPAIEIIQTLRAKKARVAYHDPFVPKIDFSKLHSKLRRDMMYAGANRRGPRNGPDNGELDEFIRRSGDPLFSIPLSHIVLTEADCVVIVTDHSCIDYERILCAATLVVDTRHAITEELRRSGNAQVVRL
jgi:UDP-N-acetyl-D-glucosamine dehydrogenase